MSHDLPGVGHRWDAEPLLARRCTRAGRVLGNDHLRFWSALHSGHLEYPKIAPLDGGTPKGVERIAAGWVDPHRVVQIVFKPDWHRHGKAAPL